MTELENTLLLATAALITGTTLVVLVMQFIRLYGKGRKGEED
jgi:hypothetical protein